MTINYIFMYIITQLSWRHFVYKEFVTSDTLLDESFKYINFCHPLVNIFFVSIIGCCFWYDVTLSYTILTYTLLISMACAMNESMLLETNLWDYPRNVIYRLVIGTNFLCNRNVEFMLYRMSKNPWNPQSSKHDSFCSKKSLLCNVVITIFFYWKFFDNNFFAILLYHVFPVMLAMFVWRCDMKLGFYNAIDYKFWGTTVLFGCVIALFFLNPSPTVSCDTELKLNSEYGNYINTFNTTDKQYAVKVKIIVGDSFKYVKPDILHSNDNAKGESQWEEKFDSDIKKIVVSYKLLRENAQLGCQLQLTSRFFSTPVNLAETGKDWRFPYLSLVLGNPTEIILKFDLNYEEQNKQLTKEIKSKNEQLNQLNKYKYCDDNLQNCMLEKNNLISITKKFDNALVIINTNNSDPVNIDNLADKYLHLVQENSKIQSELENKTLELDRETDRVHNSKIILKAIDDILQGTNGSSYAEKVESILAKGTKCQIDLKAKNQSYTTCEIGFGQYKELEKSLKNYTGENTTVAALVHVQEHTRIITHLTNELDKCMQTRTPNAFFPTKSGHQSVGFSAATTTRTEQEKDTARQDDFHNCKQTCIHKHPAIRSSNLTYNSEGRSECFKQCDKDHAP